MKRDINRTVKVGDVFGEDLRKRTKRGLIIVRIVRPNVALIVFEEPGAKVQQTVRVTFENGKMRIAKDEVPLIRSILRTQP